MSENFFAFPFSDVVHANKFALSPGDWYLTAEGLLGLAVSAPAYIKDQKDVRAVVEFRGDASAKIDIVNDAKVLVLKLAKKRINLRAAEFRHLLKFGELQPALIGTSSGGAMLTTEDHVSRDGGLAFVELSSGTLLAPAEFPTSGASLWTDRWEIILADADGLAGSTLFERRSKTLEY